MRPHGRHITACITLATALAAAGCGPAGQLSATDVNPALWNEPAELEIRNTDTLTLRDAVIFVRSNDRSADDTLTVRIVTVSPDSLRCSETLLLGMERTNGPASLARESATPYRRRIRFSHRGTYRITITPLRPARGIEAIGIDIVKSE